MSERATRPLLPQDAASSEDRSAASLRAANVVIAAAGLTLLVITGTLARLDIYGWEIAAFRAVNDLPGSLQPIVWVLNQYGTALTIPLIATTAALFRRWMLAFALATTGIAVYVLARVMKEYVGRGRPGALLEDVIERESFAVGSLGFPSGHAAVACAITLVLLPRVGRPWQTAAIVMAIVVPFARLYIAAHLPLDLIGGAALGAASGSIANLLIRRHDRTEEPVDGPSRAGGRDRLVLRGGRPTRSDRSR